MISWNYRFVRVGESVGIHEAYYEDDEREVVVSATATPVSVYGDTDHECVKQLRQMLDDVSKYPEIIDMKDVGRKDDY